MGGLFLCQGTRRPPLPSRHVAWLGQRVTYRGALSTFWTRRTLQREDGRASASWVSAPAPPCSTSCPAWSRPLPLSPLPPASPSGVYACICPARVGGGSGPGWCSPLVQTQGGPTCPRPAYHPPWLGNHSSDSRGRGSGKERVLAQKGLMKCTP